MSYTYTWTQIINWNDPSKLLSSISSYIFSHLHIMQSLCFYLLKKKKKKNQNLYLAYVPGSSHTDLQIWVQIWPSSLGHRMKILRQLCWKYTEVLAAKMCSLCRNYRRLSDQGWMTQHFKQDPKAASQIHQSRD